MSKIEFRDVSFGYGSDEENAIVKDASLTFDSSKVTVITGPSGCGKSTLLSLAAGIYPRHETEFKQGDILIDGEEIAFLPHEERIRSIGMMFQNPNLQFCMDTVENELLFCLGNIELPPDQMQERIDESLNFCEIAHLKHRLLATLSGGEKQKAMLACLVSLRPKWLLLDEPFANIDSKSAKEIVKKIQALHQLGTGVLVVDHRLDDWLLVADEFRWMNQETGTLEEGFHPAERSDHEYKALGILPPNGHYQKPTTFPSEQCDMNAPALKLKDLTVHRGKTLILDRVNYNFKRQNIYAIIGSSGSGKSTLFGAINGMYKYKGRILLNDIEVKKRMKKQVGALGFALQNPQDQFVENTVLAEISVGLKHQLKKEAVDQVAERILKEIELWGYRHFSPYMLSQGQQRRLGIAALLAYDCDVLICDEPTYAQDYKNTEKIMLSLVHKIREEKMTMIFSTHDHKLAYDYADVVLTLEEGKLHAYDQSDL